MIADLVTFLREQLDADEQAAQDLNGQRWYPAIDVGDYYNIGVVTDKLDEKNPRWVQGEHIARCGVEGLEDGELRAAHIARHDPARVLADVEAKRRIIDLHSHEHRHECPEWAWRDPDHPEDPVETRTGWALDGLCPTLRLLALPFADREGYREEWKP